VAVGALRGLALHVILGDSQGVALTSLKNQNRALQPSTSYIYIYSRIGNAAEIAM